MPILPSKTIPVPAQVHPQRFTLPNLNFYLNPTLAWNHRKYYPARYYSFSKPLRTTKIPASVQIRPEMFKAGQVNTVM